ncbi:IS5 family transposase [Treponema endosymbiont of Eucomonympha sp.]|uniref:IS5 family transposase n=1 Tax=Treponema endosymbiont of Eucomonympha sp. TaxID=1580831 RepID=UPI0013969352|nr:IS5 family transposase [Treponema endosymbiont of Eucomonympha sp.]
MKRNEGIHRHDISDEAWERIKELLPGQAGKRGGVAKDNRLFINAVAWQTRTGAPWRDIPPEFGNWNSIHKRFCRWRDKGIWKTLADAAIGEPAGDIFMIDSTYIKAHADACGARGGTQDISRTKGGLNSKLHLAVDEYGIPASGIVTSGTVADCSQAPLLMEDLEAEAFLADKAYDTNELLDMLKEADITAVIPPVKSRKEQRAYNHELYRARHVIENVFRALKRWRGIATRYAKLTASFIAAIHVRCLFLYLPVHTT